MKKIKLHGFLGDKYGKEFDMDVDTVCNAIKLIGYQVDGFFEDIKASDWRITKKKDGKEIDLDEDTVALGSVADEFNIYPAISGQKSGAGKIIAGIGLIALAVFTGGAGLAVAGMTISSGTIATVGVGLALAGIATNLAPEVDMSSQDSPSENPSFLFNGATNTSGEGRTIPLLYGKKVRTGSIIVSSGLSTEKMPYNPE